MMGKRGGEMAVVCVSHDIEMMRIADTVVMIEAGRVVEQGSFDRLVRKRGKFAGLIGVGGDSRGAMVDAVSPTNEINTPTMWDGERSSNN
jgi:ABC-type sulfate/molybdate transport systems ATPase subunit